MSSPMIKPKAENLRTIRGSSRNKKGNEYFSFCFSSHFNLSN